MEQEDKDQAELQAISQGLHQIYDPVLAEPVPVRLRMARPRRLRAAAIAAGWLLFGVALPALRRHLEALRAGFHHLADLSLHRAERAHGVLAGVENL